MPRLASSIARRAGIAALVAVVAAALAGGRVEVRGSSMAPTFADGDRLVVVRRLRPLRVGDVVAFKDPRGTGIRMIKRVAALDRRRVVVLGDNEAASTDSRAFGPLRRSDVRHLVVRRYASGTSGLGSRRGEGAL